MADNLQILNWLCNRSILNQRLWFDKYIVWLTVYISTEKQILFVINLTVSPLIWHISFRHLSNTCLHMLKGHDPTKIKVLLSLTGFTRRLKHRLTSFELKCIWKSLTADPASIFKRCFIFHETLFHITFYNSLSETSLDYTEMLHAWNQSSL